MMQATLQPPPVPPSALAGDRPRPPHMVSGTPLCIICSVLSLLAV